MLTKDEQIKAAIRGLALGIMLGMMMYLATPGVWQTWYGG